MAMAREGEILAILVLFLMLLLLHFKTTQAATYTVGDDLGWSPEVSMESWAENKKFYAGDTLVFNYEADSYNVVVVDQQGHDTCTLTANAKVFDSGHDQIMLVFGANYFITSNPEDCQLGMKMAINATSHRSARKSSATVTNVRMKRGQ
ncbi:basic blue protein-like [Hevea brasiliensis]|nr:basic blue protein-like [Hevea brasiliensis]